MVPETRREIPMKASDFAYQRPKNLEEALDLLKNDTRDIQVLAGGQSLMPMMNFRLAQPELLIDLNGLGELQFISENENRIEIGAMTRYATLEASPVIREYIPLFARVLPFIAHSAIRNRGTIGGSAALADPAAEMPALLIALDATIVARSAAGQRHIPADEFFLGLYETALASSEIIEYLSIPKVTHTARHGFCELARRHGDYAMAGVAITAQSADPLTGLRIVFFAISDRPTRVPLTEDILAGQTKGTINVEKVVADFDKLDFHGDLNADAGTKKHLAKVIFQRAFKELF
jgi:carbon-monoxide dehydrogenase medium subunit